MKNNHSKILTSFLTDCSGIDKYIGNWTTKGNYRLDIYRKSSNSALVSLSSPEGIFINRPYFNNKPTLKMQATYDKYLDDFRVVLWKVKKGFYLTLEHDIEEGLDQSCKEILAPGIMRFANDSFLDKYYKLFGNLAVFYKNS